MEQNQVFEQFMRFAELDVEQARKWEPLCQAAAVSLREQLMDGADVTDDRLTLAAAADAFYQYALIHSVDDAKSVKIGDVSVSSQSGTGAQTARALRSEMRTAIAPLLQPVCGLRTVD